MLTKIVGLLILIADIYVILKIVASKESMLTKIIWVLIVLFFPFIGLVAWYFLGPGK